MLKPQYCGKWAVRISDICGDPRGFLTYGKVLDTLLKEWRKDRSNKVLIFTKSVKLLEMLDFHLGNNGQEVSPFLK